MLIAAAAIVLLLVAAVFAGLKLTGGSSDSPPPATTALPGAADIERLLKGIPKAGNVLGSPSAPVTLVEYIDLQCPFCREFETQVLPNIVARYVRTGKLKIEARILAFIGPDSTRGRDAMIAAGEQGKAFNFAQILYENQGTENTGWLDDAIVAKAAESVPGLNPKLVFSARNANAVKQQAAAIDLKASADSVSATPTLLVGKSGTAPRPVALKSPTDQATLTRAIDAALG